MFIIALVLLGLCFGSFVGALVWRLHEGKDFVSDRSRCEDCGHVLSALDLVPVISWVALGGRCRYCHKKISVQNPVLELSMAALFVLSYIYWPVHLNDWAAWLSFGLWLVYVVGLVALFVYDMRWMLLPDVIVMSLVCLGLVDVGLRLSIVHHLTLLDYIRHIVLGATALGGFYWLLYTLSRGKWVGYGDVKLGVFMGLVLGWQGALLTLFLANILGFIFVVPGLVTGKLTRQSRVPFGPFMILAFLLVGLFGQPILNWYLSFILLK
ncbi:MAG TPA: prepilin peptidase [Patescibacteria group bacterium]|nr:prepilin peptidase [Patescibacteria group bacterium]